ncbi:MAG: class I tRNA ligase family protein, partial [Chloroflexota bacterium]|nr:class I tRNA ligase family protein [Chloroflexota bacterium]
GSTVSIEQEKELRHQTHKTIKKVGEDLERLHFNTMLAALMEFTNYLSKVKESSSVENSAAWKEAIDALLLMLAPTAPHLTEELWERTGHAYSIHNQFFPAWQEDIVAEEEFTMVIQVNGKVRDKLTTPVSISEVEAKDLALSRDRIKTYVDNREIIKILYVPGRLVNIVVK